MCIFGVRYDSDRCVYFVYYLVDFIIKSKFWSVFIHIYYDHMLNQHQMENGSAGRFVQPLLRRQLAINVSNKLDMDTWIPATM